MRLTCGAVKLDCRYSTIWVLPFDADSCELLAASTVKLEAVLASMHWQNCQ